MDEIFFTSKRFGTKNLKILAFTELQQLLKDYDLFHEICKATEVKNHKRQARWKKAWRRGEKLNPSFAQKHWPACWVLKNHQKMQNFDF